MTDSQFTHASTADPVEEVYLPVRETPSGPTPLLYQAEASEEKAQERAESTGNSFNCDTRVLTIQVIHNGE